MLRVLVVQACICCWLYWKHNSGWGHISLLCPLYYQCNLSPFSCKISDYGSGCYSETKGQKCSGSSNTTVHDAVHFHRLSTEMHTSTANILNDFYDTPAVLPCICTTAVSSVHTHFQVCERTS